MSDEPLTILLCRNGEQAKNKPVLDREEDVLREALKAAGIQVTYNVSEHHDAVHLISISQYKAFQAVNKKVLSDKDAPVILTLFNDPLDLSNDVDESSLLKETSIEKTYKNLKADEIICPWEAQALIIKHLNIFSAVNVVNPGVNELSFNQVSEDEKTAFRKYYSVGEKEKIILSFGEYNLDEGLDEVKSVARILPECEFFYFGQSKNPVIDLSHYEKTNKISNLHFVRALPLELIRSAIMNASACFIPYRFCTDSLTILAMMKGRVPVVSAKNPFLYDFLVDGKTCVIGDSVESFYHGLKNIEKVNYAQSAYDFVRPLTLKAYGEKLKGVYNLVCQKETKES